MTVDLRIWTVSNNILYVIYSSTLQELFWIGLMESLKNGEVLHIGLKYLV